MPDGSLDAGHEPCVSAGGMKRTTLNEPATSAAPPRPLAEIVADQLERETREQLRVEIREVLRLFEHAAVDLVGVSEIARDVRRLGPRYRSHGRAIHTALGRDDQATVVSELRSVLDKLSEDAVSGVRPA